jgi:glycosyl transferase family 1
MRIHLVAPTPHRDVNADWEPDAYVGKAWRLVRMLADLGHHVTLYGGPGDDTAVSEHVTVVSAEDRQRWFGDETWEQTVFNQFDPCSTPWMTMNSRTVVAMQHLIELTDIIFLTMGAAQAPIQQAFPGHVVAECGIGYSGVLANTHKCFESEAWRNYIYGRTGIDDGRWFDVSIPNPVDPDDFIFRAEKDDPGYLLFMGRHIPRKGLEVVTEIAKHHRVVTAGQGGPIPGVEYRGVVRGREKAELLAGARAVLVPTQYIPPFEGVNVEAQISGTPVICSPFGVFHETVKQGETGFLCSTLAEFLAAAEAVDDLDPKQIREWAMDRFILDVCAAQYDRWINQLATLYDRGWYQ